MQGMTVRQLRQLLTEVPEHQQDNVLAVWGAVPVYDDWTTVESVEVPSAADEMGEGTGPLLVTLGLSERGITWNAPGLYRGEA